jgi:hypothetical protein
MVIIAGRPLAEISAVDRTVAQLNIEHYKQLLARETDEQRREILTRLLKDEEAKLTNCPPPRGKRQAQ